MTERARAPTTLGTEQPGPSVVDAIGDTRLSPGAARGDVSRVDARSPRVVSGPAPPFDLGDLPVVDPGRYDLLEEIGRGGLGRVVKAFDRRLKRMVAVKEMLDGRGSMSRFVREAVATAGLEHPAIVPVHDLGVWPSGAPFYAMKLVSGRSLAEEIEARPTLAERLALLPNVIAIADAMAYAHSKRLVHRDLKPANVLVGAFGETVIIDWGIAKSLEQEGPASTSFDAPPRDAALTVAGAVLGTPAYMAPEQAAGKEVDERADVYALGAILYQVLAGSPPHDTSTPDVMRRIVAGDPIPLGTRQEGIAPELLTIVSRAMAREAAERYPSARELADDLRRFQTGQLVLSHRYSPWALVTRWLRRYRIVVLLSATLLLALAVVGAVSVRRVVRARVAAEAAKREAQAAQGVAESRTNALLLAQARALLEVDPTSALAVLSTYPDAGSDWEGVSSIASDAWSAGVARHVLRAGGELHAVAYVPGGGFVAGAGADARVHLWSTDTGAERVLEGHTSAVTSLAAAADGASGASGASLVSAGARDGRIWVWDVARGQGHALGGQDGEEGVRWIALSANGVLVASNRDKTLRVWNLATGEGRVLARCPELRECGRGAISRDGRLLAYGGVKRVHLVDVDSGAERPLPDHEAGTGALAFSDDGRTLASGGMDAKVRAWDLARGTVRVLVGHKTWVPTLAISPDGKMLATAAGESAAWLWNLETGEGRVLPAAVGDVRAAAFSPDGSTLALGGDDRQVRLWEVRSLVMRVLRGHAAPISGLAFSPDGARLATSSLDKTVRVWDLHAGGLRALPLPEGSTAGMRFSSNGKLVALVREKGPEASVVMADAKTGAMRILGDANAPLPAESVRGPDGAPLGEAEAPLAAYVMDGGSCGLGRRLVDMNACAYARDGVRVATGGVDRTVRLWDAASGAMTVVGEHEGTVLGVAFSPDGEKLASCGTDRTVRIWDLRTLAERVLRGHDGDVESVAFTSDGARVGSVSMDGTLRVWDLAAGGGVRVYGGEQIAARSLAFSGDDRFALVGERSGVVRMWELATERSRVVRRHAAYVGSLGVAPDGRTVLSNGGDGASWLWDLDATPAFSTDPGALRRWMASVTSAASGR